MRFPLFLSPSWSTARRHRTRRAGKRSRGWRHALHSPGRDLPFGRALRELCWRYRLAPVLRVDGTYLLVPGAACSSEDGNPVADFVANGLRVFPKSFSGDLRRSLSFERTEAGSYPTTWAGDRNSLFVRIGVEVAEGDPARLAAVLNWQAVDDTGRVLTSTLTPEVLGEIELLRGVMGTYPDQWETGTSLEPPAPAATRLDSLEGDLFWFGDYRRETVGIPLPLRDVLTYSLGDVTLQVLKSWNAGEEAEQWGDGCGPAVRAIIRKPPGVLVASAGATQHVIPSLVGASGKPFVPQLFDSKGYVDAGAEATEMVARYEPADEPPARLVFDLAVKSRLEARLCFRLENLPLPR